jgi:hypothetical protein
VLLQAAEKKYQSAKMAKTEKSKPKAIQGICKRKLEDLKYMAQRIVFLGKKKTKFAR